MSRRRLPLLLCTLLPATFAACGPTSRFVGGRADLSGAPSPDDASLGDDAEIPPDQPDLTSALDGPGGSAYSDLGAHTDSGACLPPNMGATCANPIADSAGCTNFEDCGTSGKGNGLDDDCNGLVDESCSCAPGDVEPCFLGPPGKHKVGACSDGHQTCFGGEFGAWGPCVGSISPSVEICDSLDNDCNGCADDGLCCGGVLQCPASVPNVNPYTDVTYNGANYYTAGVTSWSWTVVGGPCDVLFAATTNPPQQSFTITNGNTQSPTIHFTLSGDYTITMTVIAADGTTQVCTFVQHVVGPGVRFELCWDHTGPGAQGGADLDLHVHRPASTTKWFEQRANNNSPDDCNFSNCTPDEYDPFLVFINPPPPMWGYGTTPLANCEGAPQTLLGNSWMKFGACYDPRLDIDNVDIVGRPENTNIDNPKDGDTFRAMVHYYGQDNSTSQAAIDEHPIVNIYCGGVLTASFGQAPDTLAGFNFGSGWNKGQMWRVADVAAIVDANGNTTGCNVTALHPQGMNSGYRITNNDTSY